LSEGGTLPAVDADQTRGPRYPIVHDTSMPGRRRLPMLVVVADERLRQLTGALLEGIGGLEACIARKTSCGRCSPSHGGDDSKETEAVRR
jgi:hypothetical protein